MAKKKKSQSQSRRDPVELQKRYEEFEALQLSAFNELRAYDRDVRSRFIYEAVMIEHSIEQCIAWHFCKEPTLHAQFFSFLFRDGQITFSQKTLILKKILRSEHHDIYQDYRPVFSHLEKLRQFRNKLAHSRDYSPWDFGLWFRKPKKPEIGIYLEEYKDGDLVREFIPKAKVDTLWQICRAVHSFISLLPGEMENRSNRVPNVNFKLELDSMSRIDPTSYHLVRAKA